MHTAGPQSQPSFLRNNQALGKSSEFSSVFSDLYSGNRGNDGDINTLWASDVIEATPYYQVDMGSAITIARIELAARQDLDQPTSRNNVEILASNTADFSEYTVLGQKTGHAFLNLGTWILDVDVKESFRYVRVQRLNNAGHLTFSELRVLEKTTP